MWGGRPSGVRYPPAFGSGSDSVLALVAAALHSFSSSPSSVHVCVASGQPPFSETPVGMRQADPHDHRINIRVLVFINVHHPF